MRSKMNASKYSSKVGGKGVKIDYAATLRDLPLIPDSEADRHVQAPIMMIFSLLLLQKIPTRKQSNDPFAEKEYC